MVLLQQRTVLREPENYLGPKKAKLKTEERRTSSYVMVLHTEPKIEHGKGSNDKAVIYV
jgi:hypothetical protein